MKKNYYHLDPFGPDGTDEVDLRNFSLIQIKNKIQLDGCNCGVLCLKVH